MEEVQSSKYLGICFSSDCGVKEDVSTRVGERMKTFRAMKMWNVRSVNVRAKRELYKRGSTNSDVWFRSVEFENGRKVDVMERRCLHSTCGVRRMDGWRNVAREKQKKS